jgi:hypothetical protein
MCSRLGQAVQVRGGVLIELQRAGERVENLGGGVPVAALLQAHVVLGAYAGEHSDLGAPQTGNAAARVRLGEADVFGQDELASGPQVLPD